MIKYKFGRILYEIIRFLTKNSLYNKGQLRKWIEIGFLIRSNSSEQK